MGRAYEKKRDFTRTPEPRGGKRRPGKKPIFVIQKHEASSLHYDFRIEVEGVLKSWAVPKGPSLDPSQKRLAVPTEDHPLEYVEFEGEIPQGEYGAGPVIVWDRGTYENITEKEGEVTPIGKALAEGHLSIRLHGKKLRGGFALQRIGKGRKARWLLVKIGDRTADARRKPVVTQPESVLSGRPTKDVARKKPTDKGS